MMPNRITKYGSTLFLICLTTLPISAQSNNLLQNPNADQGASHWRTTGDAGVEQTSDDNWRFVVRNKGSFVQDVTLPEDSVGKYALLIGHASSERINSDGAITGLPYLYGYMMKGGDSSNVRINSYLQGQQMLGRAEKAKQWVTVWGIFEVPSATSKILFFLN